MFGIRSTVALLLAGSTGALGVALQSVRYTPQTHRARAIPNGIIHSFHPVSTYETYPGGIDHPLTKRASPASTEEAALSFIKDKLNLDENTLAFVAGFDGEAAKHAYVRQKLNGIEVANAVANVALNHQDKVVAFGSSLVKPTSVAASSPKISKSDAISAAEKTLSGKYNNWPTKLEYFVKDDGSAVLSHVVQVENADSWFEAFVDAKTAEVVAVVDFMAHAAYRVVPIHYNNPEDGFQLITDPQDPTASPFGWHATSSTSFNTTQGNNVVSYTRTTTNTTVQSAPDLVFDYTFDPTLAPTDAPNTDVARVNGFYIANSYHDILYAYGFTEKAFNFQASNDGRGGAENDAVNLSIQDASGTNNANFGTPADGQPGRCRMYIWTRTNPYRDGAVENDVIIHEFTHGLSNRLTGGGTGRCLQSTESGGMGEGWSDTVAMWMNQRDDVYEDYTIGAYVYNAPGKGLRTHPYSTDKSVNPLMYSNVGSLNEVHNIGEVWAEMLFELYWSLVGGLGFTDNYTDVESSAGNVVFLHLLVDGLAIQPCNPTFVSARDAILQADVNRYAGANRCTIWNAFAKRGLGYSATTAKVDATDVPSDC